MGLLRFLKCAVNCVAIFAVFVTVILVLPGLPPHNIQFTSYDVPPTKRLEGPLKINRKLDNAEKLFENILKGPESLVYHDGVLYTGVHGGQVVKIIDNNLIPFVKFGKPCNGIHEEHICGRPLGLHIDSKNNLYVADAYYGIFKVNISTGESIQLVSPDTVIEGRKPKLFNSITVASDGKIYWTDSDSNFDLKNLVFTTFADGTGRLLRYDPVTKTNTVLMDRLHFANGVALAADESYILVAETFKFRIMRYFLRGQKKGRSDIFVDGLPGNPDNLKIDNQGNFYVALVIAREDDQAPALILHIGKYPLLRKFLSRSLALIQTGLTLADSIFPHIYLKKAIHASAHAETLMPLLPQIQRVTIVKLNKEGEIIDSLHSIDGLISGICEVEFVNNYIYLASPFNHYLARVKLNKF